MASPPLLFLKDIRLTFGGTPVLEGAELVVGEGDRISLVGRNGSGKSTLLKIAAGLVEADGGDRFVQPGSTVRYLPQEPSFAGFATTLAYVEAGLGPGDDPYRARRLLEDLGLTGEENPSTLSGGEARRTALARVLAPEPDILLLDEPTNHLDLPAIEWLESELAGMRSAIVLISHDRRFLEKLSRATVWLDRGVTRRMERGFSHFEAWRDEVFAEEERDRHKLDRKIAMEEDWVRYGVTARRKRNQRRMGLLREMREQRRTARRATGDVKLAASEAEVSGKLVIEAVHVAKAFGGPPVVRDFSARIQRGDRIGIVGPNGAGKTTLINMLTGALAPDSGTVRLGANLQMVTLDQRRESLDPTVTLKDALTDGRSDTIMVGNEPRHVVSYMKDFLFSPEQARTPIGVLSGGERGRLMLARALARPANLLVLDEPTNDLDLETLDLLEELLADHAGTVLLISHDRDFIDRVVTSVIAYEGEGNWVEYAGGYSDMVAQRGHGVGAKSRADGARADAAPAARAAKQDSAKTDTPKAEPKRKLSFKDKHALETLPKTMAKLETDIATFEKKLAEPGLFARDRSGFETAAAKLRAAQEALAEAEEEWLRLELLKEEIGG
ncbi:ATP-binding cassette, subfamily F, uup [Pseudoxanthobacter soli DSM 19599]|uniref:ATP-binding protein Uup n=1 Tax=Pseudoxanthobacter soli DSM 19599 TaxID=1123029 RepID=A0A1M7ZJP4_9HYPH|nr:ABC-F family ATP-binding cassette domain-containing protein [Pseudoxanthobacter soli]SHO65135.1 ATP-binding cassette, subfamily F, uup [Pseudoxanthobacter soli DSM 19599]